MIQKIGYIQLFKYKKMVYLFVYLFKYFIISPIQTRKIIWQDVELIFFPTLFSNQLGLRHFQFQVNRTNIHGEIL